MLYILYNIIVLRYNVCAICCQYTYMYKCRKAKMLVSKVVEDAGGATNMPVSMVSCK